MPVPLVPLLVLPAPWPPVVPPVEPDPDGVDCACCELDGAGALAGACVRAGSEATSAVLVGVLAGALVATTLGRTFGSARAAGCDVREAGFATIATGAAPAIGEPPLRRSGTAACGAVPSSVAGAPAREDPPALVERPTAKKHANTTSAESASAAHCPRILASGPPTRNPSQRSCSVSFARRSVFTSSGTRSA